MYLLIGTNTLYLSRITHLSRRHLGSMWERKSQGSLSHSKQQTQQLITIVTKWLCEWRKLTEVLFRSVQLPLALVVTLTTKGANTAWYYFTQLQLAAKKTIHVLNTDSSCHVHSKKYKTGQIQTIQLQIYILCKQWPIQRSQYCMSVIHTVTNMTGYWHGSN